MASSKDIRDLIAARRANRGAPPRVGVPQIDPADLITEPSEPPVVVETPPEEPPEMNRPPQVPVSDGADDGESHRSRPTVIEDPRLMPIDRTATLVAFSSYLYPDRKRQVKQESISTGHDMHEIIDTALGEYFEKRYGNGY